jgi:enamine deaminase RidA (YjgF/YER057c/UK114 family)
MRNLLDDLAQTKMSFSNVVATHVYLDDIRDADLVDRVYVPHFAGKAPARTVIQPATPADGVRDAGGQGRRPERRRSTLPLKEISIIAVK